MNNQDLFIHSIHESYENVCEKGITSNTRVYPLHKITAECVQKELSDDNFEVFSLGVGNNKEYNYTKGCQSQKLDQCIIYKDEPIAGISLKNVMGNYKQNSHNYVTNMLGETAVVKEGGLKCGYILVLPLYIPYFSTKEKRYTKLERLNDRNIEPYYNLYCRNTSQYSHKPDIFNLTIIDTGVNHIYQRFIDNKIIIEDRNAFMKQCILPNLDISKVDTNSLDFFSIQSKRFLEQYSDYNSFIKSFVGLAKSSTYMVGQLKQYNC